MTALSVSLLTSILVEPSLLTSPSVLSFVSSRDFSCRESRQSPPCVPAARGCASAGWSRWADSAIHHDHNGPRTGPSRLRPVGSGSCSTASQLPSSATSLCWCLQDTPAVEPTLLRFIDSNLLHLHCLSPRTCPSRLCFPASHRCACAEGVSDCSLERLFSVSTLFKPRIGLTVVNQVQ